MKPLLKIITIALPLILFNCKNETVKIEYKYGNKSAVMTCGDANTKLYNEALYSFEDDIFNYYKKQNFKSNPTNAYAQFLRNALYGNLKYEDIISEHSLKVFEALKQEDGLWSAENTNGHLNYNGVFLTCIIENIKDADLKTTFKSLISINDLRPKLIGPPLYSVYRNALNDKYLAAYIAFDFYYSKFFDIDLTKIGSDKPESKVDFNKKPE